MYQALYMDYYFICLEQSLEKETINIPIFRCLRFASMPSDSSPRRVDMFLHALLTKSGLPFTWLDST